MWFSLHTYFLQKENKTTGSCGFQKKLQQLDQTTTSDFFFAFLKKITTTGSSHFLSPNGQDFYEVWIWNVSLRKGSCCFHRNYKKIPIVEEDQNDVLQKRGFLWKLDYNSFFSEMSWPLTLMPLVLSNFFHPGKSQ